MPSPELELRSRIERRLRRFVLEKRVSNPRLVDLISNVAAASESCAVFGGVPRRHVRGDHLNESFDIDIVVQAAVLRVYARCDIQEIASLCSAQQSIHLSFSQLSEFMSDLKLHYKASPDAHFSVKLANG